MMTPTRFFRLKKSSKVLGFLEQSMARALPPEAVHGSDPFSWAESGQGLTRPRPDFFLIYIYTS